MYQNREQNPQGGGRLNSPKNAVWQNFLSLRGSVATAAISKSFANGGWLISHRSTGQTVLPDFPYLAVLQGITRERSDRGNLFNLQLFAEKEENKTSKSKRLHLVTSLILILILALSMLPVMLISKNTNAYKSSTTTYVKVGELWNSNAKMFNNTNLNTLLKYLSSSGTIDGVNAGNVNAGTIRGYTYNNKTSSQSIVVTLGGLEWQVVYLTTHKSTGEKVATLLLNDTTDTSVWGKHTSYSVGSYPANMYGASYIRVVTLNSGGKYATSNTALSSNVSQSSSNKYAKFTMSTYGLTSHLVQPKYIGYQTTSQGKSYTGFSYVLNNEAIGVGGTSSGDNYVGKDRYDDWGNDFVWLPSLSELGYEDAHPGIWNLSVNERAISGSTYSWSRSSYINYAVNAYNVDPSGSSLSSDHVDFSRAVRPALHLNLKSAVSYAALQVSVSSSNSSQGTVTSSGAYTGTYYRNGDLATITATPKSGYIFDYWIVGGTRVNYNPHSFTVTQNTTCVAYFKAGYTVTLNTNNDSYGTVLGAGTYEKGASVTISAIPNESCMFAYWDTGGGQITTSTLTITVNSNITYTAVFIKNFTANITSANTTLNITSFRDINNTVTYGVTPVTANLYIYSVQVGNNDAQILKSRSGILDYSGASNFIRYTVNEDNRKITFEIVFLEDDIDIKLNYVNTSPNLPNASGGGVNGAVVTATEGGEARIVGNDIANGTDSDTVTYVAVAYKDYLFQGWAYADDLSKFINTNASMRLSKEQANGKVVTAVFVLASSVQGNINSETDNSTDFWE